MFYCLMSSGHPFSDKVADLLLSGARKLCREKRRHLRIKNEHCEGIVETRGDHASMGMISGQKFEAHIVAEGRTSTIHFIVRTQDMKGRVKGHWVRGEIAEWTDQSDFGTPRTVH